ncbi:ferredoxin [Pseudonocardia yunnanensis]|uniref:Ferredoxin n=1 Tax=Pseudonocardia yunnanensis TaxID=58107 RepID=A0ABW4EU88_9PSEU
MSDVKITVERDRCIGAGQCVFNAPELFDQDDEGTVVVLEEQPSPEQEPAAHAAEHACPARVISLS